MPRLRDLRLARLGCGPLKAETAARWQRATAQARAAAARALRRCLAHLGFEPKTGALARFCQAGAAEAPDVPELPAPREPPGPSRAGEGDAWTANAAATLEARLLDMAQRYRDGLEIDLAAASPAEALAWCIAQLSPDLPGEPPAEGARSAEAEDSPVSRVFAADLLQKQQNEPR